MKAAKTQRTKHPKRQNRKTKTKTKQRKTFSQIYRGHSQYPISIPNNGAKNLIGTQVHGCCSYIKVSPSGTKMDYQVFLFKIAK